ncbi:MAG: hypothetical protein M1831_005183 [Alyxoria varia]|nr:MAG: hypothetical protein M1831_005183 [Alyxoria varia]
MASQNPNPSSDELQSYRKMDVGDIDAIGAHCQMPYCRQLDFLPFRCESCRGKFCLEHRSETAHSCENAGAWARAKREREFGKQNTSTSALTTTKPNILTHESQCYHSQCKTLINTPLVPGIHCSKCRHDFCLQHRLYEDHDCVTLQKAGIGAQSPEKDNKVANAFSKLRAWGEAKRKQTSSTQNTSPSSNIGVKTSSKPTPSVTVTAPLSRTETATTTSSTRSPALQRIISPFLNSKSLKKPTSNVARTTQLSTMKRTAKGDSKIPAEKRIYVHVEAVASGNEGAAGARIPRSDMFFNKEWSVGKVLDSAAKELQITNVNNRGGGEEERLRVFWIEGGRLLGFSEKLVGTDGAKGVDIGDTLVLLRGVGTPE